VPSLTDPDIIVGIKEPPVSELTRPRTKKNKAPTHLMFSHTMKGQPYNMPLLSTFLSHPSQKDEVYPRLVDYELLTDSQGKRTIGFGWYAGGECLLCLLLGTINNLLIQLPVCLNHFRQWLSLIFSLVWPHLS